MEASDEDGERTKDALSRTKRHYLPFSLEPLPGWLPPCPCMMYEGGISLRRQERPTYSSPPINLGRRRRRRGRYKAEMSHASLTTPRWSKPRGSHQASKPVLCQNTYLLCSKCNEICRKGKMCPLEGVQTIFFMYFWHTEDLFSNLESLQASQAESSVCPHQASQAETFPGNLKMWAHRALVGTQNSLTAVIGNHIKLDISPMSWACWLEIVCTLSGGPILDVLQVSSHFDNCKYVIWSESGIWGWRGILYLSTL